MIIRLVGNLGYTVNLFFIDLVLLILALSLLILLFLVFKYIQNDLLPQIVLSFGYFT